MKIQAYKCRFSGKVFENRHDFQRHLEGIRQVQQAGRANRRVLTLFNQEIEVMRNSVYNVNDLEAAIRKNWHLFYRRAWLSRAFTRKHEILLEKDIPALTALGIIVQYSDCVSNSHHSPHDGVQNWERTNQLPLGYPGWLGSIQLEFSKDGPIGGTDVFRNTPIQTGGGGARGRLGCQYELYLFASDWPAWSTWRILNNQSTRA